MTAMRTFLFLLLICPTLCAAPPNIVFILADDFGYGDLGCMGCKDIATPNIDRLATEGVKFTDFYANAPVCTPTRAGFMTGRWQQRCGIEFAFGYQVEQFRRVKDAWVPEPDIHGLGLPLGETTIAQRLKYANYATGAFGKWHLGFKDAYNPTKRGFDEYFGELLGHADYYKHTYYDGTYALRDGLEPVKREGYLTDLINERAVKFIRDHKRRRSSCMSRTSPSTRRLKHRMRPRPPWSPRKRCSPAAARSTRAWWNAWTWASA